MGITDGDSIVLKNNPAIYYSAQNNLVLNVNERFEDEFSLSQNIIGQPVDKLIQPVLEDISWHNKEKNNKKYAFLCLNNTCTELVKLSFGEAQPDHDILVVIVHKVFSSEPSKPSEKTAISLRDLVFLLDDEGSFTQINAEACQKLGFKKEELLELGIADLIPISIKSYTYDRWDNFMKRGKTSGEHLVKTKNGEIIFVEYQAVTNVRLGSHLLIMRVINTVVSTPNLALNEVNKETTVLDESLSGIIFTNSDFKLLHVNQTCLNLLGYKKEQMLGQSVELFCKSRNKLEQIKHELRNQNQWQGRLTVIKSDETEIEVEVKITAMPADKKENVIWEGTLRDISARLKAEKNLLKAEHRFNRLLQAAPDGILIVDKSGNIEYSNPKISSMLGYEEEELIGQPVEVLVPTSKQKEHVNHHQNYLKNPRKRAMGSGMELHAKHKDGSKIPVDIMLGPFEENGKQTTIAIVRDISKYRNTQKKLEQEKEFTKLLHRLTTIANQNTNLEEKLEDSIRVICRFMNWPVGHVYLPANDGSDEFYPSDIWYIQDEEKFESFRKMTMCTRFEPGLGMVGEVIESGVAQWYSNAHKNPGFVRRMPDIDLNIRACFGLPVLIKDEVVGVLEFFSDKVLPSDGLLLKKMTTIGHQLGRAVERIKSEDLIKKNMKLFKQLFDHSPAGVIILDENEEVTNVNKSFTQIFGYEPDEITGKKLEENIIPKKLQPEALELNQRTFGGETVSEETIRITKSGNKIPVVIHTVPVKINGKIEAIFGIYVDLSKIKETENQLRDSLQEKKFLLEEIHHRVKNNLAIITSLLELQIHQAEDEKAISQLRDSQSRIYSMSMVHEHLYQMESFSYLELDKYLKKLTKKISSTFSDPDSDIDLIFNTENIKVTLDQAVSCGQLINELVTNSFKHAFQNIDKGSITISLYEKKGKVNLEISDSGPGIPETVLSNEQSSLGLKLVNALTQQLEGKLEVNQDDGTTFILTFPKQEIDIQS